MALTVQARLDKRAEEALRSLTRSGFTTSRAVREGLLTLAALHGKPLHKKSLKDRIIGLGSLDSGIPDLATNKKYLDDLGH